ncbi:hypothetical protein ACFL4P_02460, partial [Gemmatimonadota bacterium]
TVEHNNSNFNPPDAGTGRHGGEPTGGKREQVDDDSWRLRDQTNLIISLIVRYGRANGLS